jgi:membrane protease YdiL (CAAX protease family)
MKPQLTPLCSFLQPIACGEHLAANDSVSEDVVIRHWFVNADDGRLRAGWRILAFILILMAIAAGGQTAVRAALGGLPRGSTLVLAIIAVAATIAVLVARRFLDRKAFISLGLSQIGSAWKDLLFGFALSAAMAGLVLWLMVVFGFVSNVQVNWSGSATILLLLSLLLPNMIVGYWEELVFRGYLLQNMIEGMGLKLAVVTSCLLYGLLHAGNPNATLLSSVIIVLFGYLRIYGYLSTGLLWLSMGMHIGWNFFQSAVFGFAASGHVEDQTLFSHDPAAPDWLTGGEFGPEGSVLIIPVLLLALFAMYLWTKRRNAKSAGPP